MRLTLRAVLLSVVLSWSASIAMGGEEANPMAPADQMALRQSIDIVRSVGRAMYSWVTDQQQVPRESEQAADPAGYSPGEPSTYAWSACPAITHDEARTLLVPAYLAELPTQDGWGHPLELCLRRGEAPGQLVVGIRSAGRDGAFEGDAYLAGPFDPARIDADVVWVNGYFVRWPEK
jgi:hypothetical protein